MKRIFVLTGFLLVFIPLLCSAQTITLHRQNISLKQLFDEIRKQTGYDFLYDSQLLTKAKPVDVDAVNSPLKTVLDNCFANQPLTYVIDKKTIIVKEKQAERYSAWSVINGRIINKESNTPLSNASVFLNNNTGGAASNPDGTFTLTNVKPGSYDMVVSLVGFEIWHQFVNVAGTNIDLQDIKLTPKAIGLKEVVVKSGVDKYWKYHYALFKEVFLGSSDLAKQCEILNPEVLDLGYDANIHKFTASSDDFLVIENDALGYRLKYLVTAFTSDSITFNLSYKGSVLFEEMKGSAAQERAWLDKRRQVYERSQMHFLRALLSDQLDDEGFRALRYTYKKSKKTLLHVPLTQQQLLSRTDVPGVYAIAMDSSDLYVEYNKRRRFHENDKLSIVSSYFNLETSIVSFDKHFILFDQNGWVLNPDEIVTAGAWARNRAAELLPANYEPFETPSDNKIVSISNDNDASKILLGIKSRSDSLLDKAQAEKIYIRLDKSQYTAGDTIWFKAWIFNASMLSLSAQSGVLHMDIADGRNNVTRKYVLRINDGVAWAQIPLDTGVFKEGRYTLRAYTNWMRNFGDETFFYKPINIVNADDRHWLVNTAFRNTNDSVINARLQLTSLNKIPVADSTLVVKAMAGTNNLFRQRIKTDDKGMLDLKVMNPKAAKIDSIIIENANRSRRAIIPVTANREIDLQFMPEGGSLLNGANCRVGFKAIDNSGKGIDVTGIIVDQSGRQVASFKSSYRGMGNLELKPEKGQVYSARLSSPGAISKTYQLPLALNSGLGVFVRNDMQSDSLEVDISSTNDIPLLKNTYFLIGRSRGVICFAATVHFEKEPLLHRRIAKNLFPTGIAHLVLVTANNDPISDRPVYIDHHDGLHIEIQSDRDFYSVKDSVALHVKVTNNSGEPVPGNFCLLVNDNGLVKADTLNDINSHVLLSSELKGYVENPGYYLKNDTAAWKALDNLLLTQGWVKYEPLLETITRQPEKEFTVSGRVNNVFNAPVKKTDVLLLSSHPAILMDTLTDEEGRFTFSGFPRVDTPVFVLQARNRHGKSFNVNIKVEEVTPPAFNAPQMPAIAPWYVNIDTTLGMRLKNDIMVHRLQDSAPGINTHHLKEVKIIAKKIVKGSENLNGPGNADITLDEKDLEAAGKKSFLQLLSHTIPGFTEQHTLIRVDQHYEPYDYYTIFKRKVYFIVSGVMITRMYPRLDLKQYLEFNNAEDIKGIEVAASGKYVGNYIRRFFPSDMISQDTLAFIEITTRSGSAVMPFEPGLYLYKPLALTTPLQFYKPKYSVKDTSITIDSRSTIDWEPNLVTDEHGEATVLFYAGTSASNYTILMEGTDLNGNLGAQRKKIIVGQVKEAVKSK